MPFLSALFCVKGFDNRQRFLLCALFSLLSFVSVSFLFSAYLLVNIVTLLLACLLLTLSCRRRLRDANRLSAIQLLPGFLLLITGLLSLAIDNGGIGYLFLVPSVCIGYFMTYPAHANHNKIHYILGYAGPIDLSQYKQASPSPNKRIEPTLTSSDSEHDLITGNLTEKNTLNQQVAIRNHSACTQEYMHQDTLPDDRKPSWQVTLASCFVKFAEYCSNSEKVKLGLLITIILGCGFILIYGGISAFNTSPDSTLQPNKNKNNTASSKINHASVVIDKKHLLNMPDNFSLYLSQYQGVTINWQADTVSNGQLWAQLSNQGDTSCQQLSFNKGASIRPVRVNVENNNDYFAYFSPLDTRELIKALAFRGTFSLCGYHFSLKGSQATLGKHEQYAIFLEQQG